MNYNAFTKKELIEAIENANLTFEIDDYLTSLWYNKTQENLNQFEILNTKYIKAMQAKNYTACSKIQMEINKNEKEHKRLKKAIE